MTTTTSALIAFLRGRLSTIDLPGEIELAMRWQEMADLWQRSTQHLGQGMPTSFCYCGSGWYRRQWEGAIGKPVTIEVVQSIVKGDDVCQFAIHLPDDL